MLAAVQSWTSMVAPKSPAYPEDGAPPICAPTAPKPAAILSASDVTIDVGQKLITHTRGINFDPIDLLLSQIGLYASAIGEDGKPDYTLASGAALQKAEGPGGT